MTENAGATGEEPTAPLGREVSDLLVELSIALHRHAMYPGDHPSLLPASNSVMRSLSKILERRRHLWIGVAQKRLIVDRAASEERHPVLTDLARRLHAHEVGALVFERGVTLHEVRDLLGELARDPDRERPVVEDFVPEEPAPGAHVRLYPVGYERLGMTGPAVDEPLLRSHATQLWIDLANAVVPPGEEVPGAPPDGGALARALAPSRKGRAGPEVVGEHLRRLAEELRGARGEEADDVRREVARLVRELDPEELRRILEMGGSFTERKAFLLDASKGLPADAVVTLLQAAARATGQTISTSLTRMLSKLAIHSRGANRQLRAEAEDALRDHVAQLISDWELDDPNPDRYTRVLDTLARASPILTGGDEAEDRLAGADRILQMALEVDAYGPTLEKAVSDLVDEGKVGFVLQTADAAPGGSRVAARLRRELTTPDQLRRLLAREDVDEESLRQLVARMGGAAVGPLFDRLIESEFRSVRRKVFDCLRGLGAGVAEEALERLSEDSPWWVKRNMLALLQELDERPAGLRPMRHVGHSDARVRREAFPLAFRDPSLRIRALAQALADSDERIVRMALLELREGAPETLVPVIVNRVLRSESFPGLRSLAVRSIRTSESELAMEALLGVCTTGRTWFGRLKLAPKSPEVVAAIRALAGRWADRPEVRSLLRLAGDAKDLQIRAAVSSSEERP